MMSAFLFQLDLYHRDAARYPNSLEDLYRLQPSLRGSAENAQYVLSYELRGPDAFSLTARPKEYGVSGVRSYRSDQTYITYATAADREAAGDDPVAPGFEVPRLAGTSPAPK
jgi:hypothetical protein